MFLGELSRGGDGNVRTFVRGIFLLILSVLIHFASTGPAHTASSGCTSVTGGAFNLSAPTANDAFFVGLTFTFEAGDTLTFTTAGNPNFTDINIGGTVVAVAVIGNTAQFVFPAAGNFSTDAIIVSNGLEPSTLTVVCQSTQDALKTLQDALKTLTDPLRIIDLNQQRLLLQDINDTFLQGATVALLIEQLETRLAQLMSRLNELDRLIAQVTAERRRLSLAIRKIDEEIARLESSRPKKSGGLFAPYTGKAHARMETFDSWSTAKRLRASFIKSANSDAAIWRGHSDEPLTARATGKTGDIYLAQIAPMIAKNLKIDKQIRELQVKKAVLQQALNATGPTLVRYTNERKRLARPISPIQGELAGLRARIGQSAPFAGFAGANLQDVMGLTSEPGSSPFARNPMRFRASDGNLSFFTDLSSMRRLAQSQAALQQAGGQGPEVLTQTGTAALLNPAYNIWAKGNFTDFDSNQRGADRDGHSASFATGAYVTPSARFMIGTMYRYRNAESSSTALASNVEVIGHGAGAYSTLVLSPKVSLSGHLLYERSESDVTTGSTRGEFDTDQITLSSQLQGSFWRGPFWLRPALGITYAHADQNSYTDSSGARIAGRTSERGQLTFGPRIGYRVWREGKHIKFIEPSLSATGIWTFLDEGDTTLASSTIIEQDDVSAQFTAGVSLLFKNNSQLSINAGYAGLGESEVESFSIGGQITIPLGR